MNVDPLVISILSRAELNGQALTLTGQLDRKTYVAVDNVLTAAGGRWDKRAKAHLFDGDAAEAIEPIILTGTVQRTKQDFGQFDSPAAVVSRVIELAGDLKNAWVLEPSAGLGNIAVAAIEAGALVDTIECDPRRNAALTMRIAKLTSPAAANSNGRHADFLSIDPGPEPGYDIVLMNPPFAKQADIAHVMHAMGFLRRGGRLVSVMSSSIKFRDDRRTREFRDYLAHRAGEIHDLPEGSFRASGTAVNAVVIRLWKDA